MINVFTQVGLGNQEGTPKNFAALMITFALPQFGNNLLQYIGQNPYDFTNNFIMAVLEN